MRERSGRLIQARISADLDKRIREASKRDGMSVADWVRRALSESANVDHRLQLLETRVAALEVIVSGVKPAGAKKIDGIRSASKRIPRSAKC